MLQKICLGSVFVAVSLFAQQNHMHGNMNHGMSMPDDKRTSLGIKGTMQGEHQLSNMRDHLLGVSDVIKLLNDSKFDEASRVAKEKLGLTTEMQNACGSFNDKTFEALGLAFHKAGDELSETIKTKDYKKSVQALQKVTESCVACHSAYKQ